MIQSPCINVCRMHAQHGLCTGCYRTLDEVARWSAMDEAERSRVLDALLERRSVLGPLRKPRAR